MGWEWGCWDDDITSDEMDHSRKFPVLSTSKWMIKFQRKDEFHVPIFITIFAKKSFSIIIAKYFSTFMILQGFGNLGKTIINHPPVITIFVGAMFTIPSHGWFMTWF